MLERPQVGRTVVALALLLAPSALLGSLRLLNAVDTATAASTFVGCGVAAAGGLLSGVIAERLLHRGQRATQHLVGVGATTAVSVITIGVIYLAHMRSPMSTIGTAHRAIEQLLSFSQFISAQGASVVLLIRSEPPHRPGT